MANYDQRRRNTSSYASDENWDKNQGRYVDDNNYRQRPGDDQGYMDLDRDGNIGNTGGFYGGTSYLGSNYGADWNSSQNRGYGNYGASGYENRYNEPQRRSQDYGYNPNPYRRDDWRENRGRQDYGNMGYGQGQQYGSRKQGYEDDWNYRAMRDMYGQGYSNMQGYGNRESYGWQNQQPAYGNRPQNYYESAYGNRYENRGGYGGYGSGDYRDMRGVSYGEVYHGNVEERERQTNQAQGGRYAGRGRWNEDYRGYEGSNYDRDRDWWDRTRDEVASWFGDEDAERRREMDKRMRGEHRGKGPKEYRRSDSRIQEDVCDRLADDDYLDASDIEVKVENGEVILSGTVDSRNAKRRAEDLVESVSGVKQVQNNLRVGQVNTVGSSVVRSTGTATGSTTDTDSTRDLI